MAHTEKRHIPSLFTPASLCDRLQIGAKELRLTQYCAPSRPLRASKADSSSYQARSKVPDAPAEKSFLRLDRDACGARRDPEGGNQYQPSVRNDLFGFSSKWGRVLARETKDRRLDNLLAPHTKISIRELNLATQSSNRRENPKIDSGILDSIAKSRNQYVNRHF